MQIPQKIIVILVLILMTLSMPLLAQQVSGDGKNSASLETLKEDFLKLGQELKLTASEASDLFSQWLSNTSTSLEEKATAATIRTKLGVVMETNKNNLTITIVESSGKIITLAITESTPILIQDAVTGLQTPFVGGKSGKFKNIKKGDWINYSYNLQDVFQQTISKTNEGPITAQTIDILR